MTENENELNEEKEIKQEIPYKDIIDNNENWKKNNDINMSNVINRIKYMQTNLRNSYNQLLEQDNDKDKNETLITEKKSNISKKKTIDKLSPLAKRLLLKAQSKIDKVNESQLGIAKLNYLFYLYKPSINNNISCDTKGRKIHRSKSGIFNENKNKKNLKLNNSMRSESEIIKKIQNKSLLKNFVYINNNYHKQLHKAFMNFKPISHLNNMKDLLEAVPSFYKDIEREKKEVESDIYYNNDKFKFKRKYLNYQKKNQLSLNNPRILFEYKNKKNINNSSVSLPKIKIKEDKEKEENKHMNIPMKFINKLKKNRGNKGNELPRFKQNKINELNKLISISSDINNLINNETIDSKIKEYVNDYNLVKNQSQRNRFKHFEIDLSKIDYFGPEKKAVDKNLESFYLKKYFNCVNNNEKNLFNKLNSELEIFNNKNIEHRDISLNELDSFLYKNNINIIDKEID